MVENLIKESLEFKFLFKKSMNLLFGKYQSKLKGDGLEFIDLKEYQYGDDVRKIDWSVFARENKLYIKEYLEEKDANVYVLLDISASLFNKEKIAKILATSLLISAYNQGNSFSLILFNKNSFKVTKLSKSKNNLMKYIYEISNSKFHSRGEFYYNLKKIGSIIQKRAIINLITDEINLGEKEKNILKVLNNKHKLNYFHIINSEEKNLDLGLVCIEDVEENNSEIFDLSQEEIEEYKKEYDRAQKKLIRELNGIEINPKVFDASMYFSKQIKQEV